MAVRSYRDLVVWQKSVDVVVLVYELTASFPSEERFGLTSQMRRAAVSIAANLAEGSGRSYRREFLHHVSFARGSQKELEALLLVSERLRFTEGVEASQLWRLVDQVGRMLWVLRTRLKA